MDRDRGRPLAPASRGWRLLGLALALLLALPAAPAAARPQPVRASLQARNVPPPGRAPVDLVQLRLATQFLRAAPAEARRTLCTDPGSRSGLAGLGAVLQRGSLDRNLLLRVVSNPHARPYLVNTMRALAHVDQVPGVPTVLGRLAEARDNGGVRGAAFEVLAGACLRDQLRGLGVTRGRHEVDGLLADGTVVEMKDRRRDYIGKVKSQLGLRCAPGGSSMLVLPQDPDPSQLRELRRIATATGTRFSVMVADPITLTARRVLTEDGRSGQGIQPVKPPLKQRPAFAP